MSQVAIAISTISANRIVYAEGSVNRRFLTGGSARTSACCAIGTSAAVSPRDRSCVALCSVTPRCGGVRDLEPNEAVHDVEHRAEEVEEAEREVGGGRDAEDPGDVGAAGVPRDQHRGHRPGVLDR